MIADLLNLNLNDLRRDLLAQGVQVNEIEVDVDAHGQGEFEGQEREQSSDEGGAHEDGESKTNGGRRRGVSIQA